MQLARKKMKNDDIFVNMNDVMGFEGIQNLGEKSAPNFHSRYYLSLLLAQKFNFPNPP